MEVEESGWRWGKLGGGGGKWVEGVEGVESGWRWVKVPGGGWV